jgi:hypothetical protein
MLALSRASAAQSVHCSLRARSILRRAAPAGARGAAVVASSGAPKQRSEEVTRRDCLAVLAAVPLLAARPALADDDEVKTFYGAAQPPATYGGVGGCRKEQARYSLSVPAAFTEQAVRHAQSRSPPPARWMTGTRCHKRRSLMWQRRNCRVMVVAPAC